MKTDNTATITTRAPKFNRTHRKETPCYLTTYTVLETAKAPDHFGQLPAFVDLRIYSTKGSTVSAAVWLNDGKGYHSSGTGSAGGGGYHKPSAAAHYALENAGVDLSNPIDGRGDSSIRDAVIAVALAMGCKRPALVESHA